MEFDAITEATTDLPSPPRFADMTEVELEDLRKRLSLNLPLPRLMALALAYQKEEDPSEKALVLWDGLLYRAMMRPGTTLLAALQTSDADTARALSDLVAHSKGASGITPQPTPAHALRVLAERQLSRGILPPPPDYTDGARLCLLPRYDLPLSFRKGLWPVDGLDIEDTPFRATLARPYPPCPDTAPHTGDHYSLIATPQGEDAKNALALLLTAPDVAKKLRFVCHLDKDGYGDVLLSRPQGLEADPSVLATEQIPLPDGYLVCADRATTRLLMQRVVASCLTMTTFARATDTGRLVITERQEPLCSLPVSRLLILARPRAVDVRPHSSAAEVRLTPACRHELGDRVLITRTLPLCSDLSARNVRLALEEALTAIQTDDAHPSTVCLSVGITESSSTSQCALWSAVLGIWMAVTAHDVALAPAVFASAGERQSAVTLALSAKRCAPNAHPTAVPAQNEPILASQDEENL